VKLKKALQAIGHEAQMQARLDHEIIIMTLTRSPVYLVDINNMCRHHGFGTRERVKLMRTAKKLGLWKQPEGVRNYGN